MNLINDLKIVYKKALKETVVRIKKNPIVLILPLLYSLLLSISHNILAMFMGRIMGNVLIGFLIPIVSSMILSSYFELLSDLNFYNRLGFKNFIGTFKKNSSSIYSVYFILILISWIVPMFGGNFSLVIILNLILFFVFNSISEAIYIRGEYYTSAFSYTFNFFKENIVHWTLPLVIYLGIYTAIFKAVGFITLISNDIITFNTGYPVSLFDLQNIKMMAPIIIIELITAVYVVFRGALYQILSTSTMRKRQYMGEI